MSGGLIGCRVVEMAGGLAGRVFPYGLTAWDDPGTRERSAVVAEAIGGH